MFFLFAIGNVKAETKQFPEATLYQCLTSDTLTVAWDNPDNLLTEFYFWNLGEETKYLPGTTNSNQINIKLPRTGLYVFYARFKTGDTTYTEWMNSMDKNFAQVKPIGQTDYVAGAWVLYGHIAPPTGGGVERTITRKGVSKSKMK